MEVMGALIFGTVPELMFEKKQMTPVYDITGEGKP
jgi:hypothetical protein